MNVDSPRNPLVASTVQSYVVSQPFQFPGKGYLQGQNASRSAQISRLTYEAAVRDVRAQAETAYYQILLEQALIGVAIENVDNLRQVLNVAQIAYTANRVTQTDFINAEFGLVTAEQTQRQLEVSLANDKVALNQVLFRRPDER